MEGIMEFEIDNDDKKIKISKALFIIFSIIYRLIAFVIGIWIFFELKECLLNPNTNLIVTGYLSIISLLCFQIVGMPVSKLINLEFVKSTIGV